VVGGRPRRSPTLRAGFGRAVLQPPAPYPLAGYITWTDRLAGAVRDDVEARALCLDDGHRRVAVCALDVLVVTQDLAQRVVAGLGPGWRADEVFVAATHTHSGPGGYWPTAASRFFMGRLRPAVRDHLVEAAVRAITDAAADLQPARPSAGRGEARGLTSNRCLPCGPTDDEVVVLRLERNDATLALVEIAGHPVVVAEHDQAAVSADWPGAVRQRLEARGLRPVLLTGALAGLSVIFPEFPTPLDRHLDLVATLATDATLRALDGAEPLAGPAVGAAIVRVATGTPQVRLYPGSRPVAHLASWPLRQLLSGYFRAATEPGSASVPVHAVRVGAFALLGFPCDLGVEVALALRAAATASGHGPVAVASQVGGYAGYVHHPSALAGTPAPSQRDLFTYENAMGFFGPSLAGRLEDAAATALGRAEG
jgi:neutral ceramidase